MNSSPRPAPRGLHGALVHDLGRKIVDGVYPPGTALSPDDLCADYGASRPTVREALRVLESKGLLRIRQSLGTRVQPIEQWNLLDSDVVTWRIAGREHDRQVRDLVQMRIAVEPVAASLAAQQGDSGMVARLAESFAAMKAAVAVDDVHGFTEADVSFHGELLRGCGNQMFPLLTSLVSTALEAREEALAKHEADLSVSALNEHGAVLQAIQESDSESAEHRMRAMLRALLLGDAARGTPSCG